jgi:hypothetical protein
MAKKIEHTPVEVLIEADTSSGSYSTGWHRDGGRLGIDASAEELAVAAIRAKLGDKYRGKSETLVKIAQEAYTSGRYQTRRTLNGITFRFYWG